MYKHVLVPVAFDAGFEHLDPLPIAKTLVAGGGKISLLHVMEEVPSYAVNFMPDDFRNESRDAIRAELQGMAARLPNANVWVVDGHAGRTILDWAEEHAVDLIVMASHHPGLGDYLLGSTAARVVRHANCSVHVIR